MVCVKKIVIKIKEIISNTIKNIKLPYGCDVVFLDG